MALSQVRADSGYTTRCQTYVRSNRTLVSPDARACSRPDFDLGSEMLPPEVYPRPHRLPLWELGYPLLVQAIGSAVSGAMGAALAAFV